jgi:hypothetical protein
MSDSDHGWMFDQVRQLVRAGTTKKELFDSVKGMTYDPKTAEVAGKLRGYAAKLWNQAEAEERTWKGVSTNDRIDAAFEDLTRAGVFSAQNFTCCSSCGHGEAAGIMGETRARGYVFYHQQDTERGVEGGGLMLAYGAHEGESPAIEAIGREICDMLERYGIPHRWNGSGDTRIEISPFEWRKRCTTKSPPIPPGTAGVVLARSGEDEGESPAPAPKEPEPAAVLRHADGREWSARITFGELRISIRDTDGDVHERVVRTNEPRVELERRLTDLRADGFA